MNFSFKKPLTLINSLTNQGFFFVFVSLFLALSLNANLCLAGEWEDMGRWTIGAIIIGVSNEILSAIIGY